MQTLLKSEEIHRWRTCFGSGKAPFFLVVGVDNSAGKMVFEAMKMDGDFRYRRGVSGVNYVPERRSEDVILG